MEKDKLIELSKQYFENKKDLQSITATSDGNFFYTASDASYHMAKNDLKIYTINRSDIEPKKEPKEEIKEVVKPVKNIEKKVHKKNDK